MFQRKTTIQLALALTIAAAPAWAISTGAPIGASGAPGEETCVACHGGSPNTGSGRIRIQVPAGAETYVPGQRIRLSVLLEDGPAQRWGFQLKAAAGTLSVVDGDANVQLLAPDVATHTSTGTRRGTRDSATWELDWTPPSDGGPATFYVAGNAANGNGAPTGDLIYASSLTLRAASATPQISAVVPQAAFGPGMSTSLYLYNSRDSAADVTVRWLREDGQPAFDPQTVNIASRGTATVETPAANDPGLGWVALDGPLEVSGYAVLRGGREVTLPLASASSKKATFVFEEAENLRTAVALLNPGESEIVLTLTARDSAGTTITAFDIPLKSRERVSFAIADRAELRDLAGRRGSIEVSTPSGSVVVHATRTSGESIAVIPVSY